MTSFYLIWQYNDQVLRGQEDGSWVDGALTFPVTFPGRFSEAKKVTLRSSARDSNTLETLTNVKLFLTGDADDLQIVQSIWPAMDADRPELNGGLEISFDEGRTYTRFSSAVGLQSNSGTWITLPASAIGLNGTDGKLGPFDQAHMLLRYKIPPGADQYRVFDVRLGVSFDVV